MPKKNKLSKFLSHFHHHKDKKKDGGSSTPTSTGTNTPTSSTTPTSTTPPVQTPPAQSPPMNPRSYQIVQKHMRDRTDHHETSSSDSMDMAEGEVAPPSGLPEILDKEILNKQLVSDESTSSGALFTARCRHKEVLVKVLFKQMDEEAMEAFKKEVAMLSNLYHPNILLFLGACTTVPGQLMLVYERLANPLEDLLLDPEVRLTLGARMRMARDAALGVLWLHSSNPVIVHRNLKTKNLMVDSTMHVKVGNFSFSVTRSKYSENGQLIQRSSSNPEHGMEHDVWMPPEVLTGQNFDEKVDVYSFGLVLWQMLARTRLVFDGAEFDCNSEDFGDLQQLVRAVTSGVRPPIPSDCPPALKSLIEACWQTDPAARPKMNFVSNTLADLRVDCAIEDEQGAKMWKKYFLELEQVTWVEFLNKFAICMGMIPEDEKTPFYTLIKQNQSKLTPELEINLICLKYILVRSMPVNGRDLLVVTMESFGQILASFGNLQRDGINIMNRIRNVMSEGWFHGDVATEDSEARLADTMDGTFLVRFSTSQIGAYTISKKFGDTISHQRISRTPDGNLVINGNSYGSIIELINGEKENLHLLVPCEGSKYVFIFKRQEFEGYLPDEKAALYR